MNIYKHGTIAVVVAAAVAALMAVGCGAPAGRVAVVPAAGTVTCQGKPLAGAIVRFHPATPTADDLPLTTTTGADGRFALSTYVADDGVPPGDYTVTVMASSGADADGDGGESAHPDDLSPAERKQAAARNRRTFAKAYLDAATSPLKATVTAAGPNDFPFDLEPRDARDNAPR